MFVIPLLLPHEINRRHLWICIVELVNGNYQVCLMVNPERRGDISLFQVQTIATAVFRFRLLPKRFALPVGGEAHSSPVHIGIFGKKAFKFLFECVIGVYGVEQVDNHRKHVIHPIDASLSVDKPSV